MSEASKLEMTRLGGYTIVRKLAKGGMAEIYLARNFGPEGFEKLVVLKRILPRYETNPKFVQLFLDEAKLAASLDHPNIVQVYDMGQVDGHYFFTMEYVHGQDARAILRKASRVKGLDIPVAIAVQIVRAMASGLHHAHERKRADGASRDIVHRDVSPSNILVSYDGAIKLADFGVAKAASSSVRTRTGALKGKVGYMSPEQARGMTIDRRSDVFSLGVVLWELLAMRRLFKTDNDLATIQAIINAAPPPLASVRADCPPELDRIVGRALEKDPAARYQTAQQLQRDLEELAREAKLDQSPIALSAYLNELFAEEIAAYREAQAAGATVTDFLVAHTGNATPVSESDFALEDAEEDEPSDVEVDDEASDVVAAPPAEIEPEDATDFGPPPVMLGPGGQPIRAITSHLVPRAPVLPQLAPRDTVREDNPFDNAATTSRQRPLEADTAFANEAPTTVNQATFTDEAPTVSAPPEILAKAFAEGDETVQAVRRYPSTPKQQEHDTVPFAMPSVPPPMVPTKRLPSVAPMPVAPTPTGFEPELDPALEPTNFDPIASMHHVEPLAPPQPMPIGSFPPGTMPVGSSGSPAAYALVHQPGHPPIHQPHPPYLGPHTPVHGYPELDPNLAIDLAPARRWLVIAGIAVAAMVIVILLIVIFSRGGDDEAEPLDEPAPRAQPAPAPAPTPSPDPAPQPARTHATVAPAPAAAAPVAVPVPAPPPKPARKKHR